MEIIEMFVNFDRYCPFCKHVTMDEVESPCEECLTETTNEYTDRPVKWEPKGQIREKYTACYGTELRSVVKLSQLNNLASKDLKEGRTMR